jgi:polygalacturonase
MKIQPTKLALSFFSILISAPMIFANESFYNVKNYGALGDGKNLDSKAINLAIEAAEKTGGGTVYIPAGNYWSGSIRLKSNIHLFIDQGATIIAATVNKENDYDDAERSVSEKFQDYGHSHFKNSLIWGSDLVNVSITGTGLINGKNLYHGLKGKKGDYIDSTDVDTQTANKAICLYRCRNVIMRDITILSGGWFAILATGVDNLTIDNIKIDTNRDGMDIDCCKNVRINNCHVNSPTDDGICLKSSFALGYARDTENITITNCIVSGFVEGSMLDGTFQKSETNKRPFGRIKFGTETNGGFKNITISNCVFNYCKGLAIMTVDGGSIEDVSISNITMRDVVNDPIFIRIGSRLRGPKGTTVGSIKRIKISNLIASNVNPEYVNTIAGIAGHAIEDVELSNVSFYYKGGGEKGDFAKFIPENDGGYPEPGLFGKDLPVYGLFVRHANNLSLNNVNFYYLNEDARMPILFDDVQGADFRFVNAQKVKNTDALVLKNCSDIRVFESLGMKNKVLQKTKFK